MKSRRAVEKIEFAGRSVIEIFRKPESRERSWYSLKSQQDEPVSGMLA